MKRVTKKTVAAIVALTMAVSAMAAVPVYVSAVDTTSQSVADALAKVKYTDTTIDVRQTYNAASAVVSYTASGDYAVAADGSIIFDFDGIEPKDFADNIVKSVKVTIKSGSTTTSITLVGDEETADNATNEAVSYEEDIEKLFTSSDNCTLTLNAKDFPDALQTIYKSNKNLEAASAPTKTGLAWNSDGGWDVRKAKMIDSVTVEITLEQQTAAAPTKKELSKLGGLFNDVELNILGDIREYTIASNKLYVAAKYDPDVSSTALPDTVQSKIDNLKALSCYIDFDNYVTELADETFGDNVVTFTETADAIADYMNYGLIVDAYHNTVSGTGNAYWYDSARTTSDEATAAIAASSGKYTGTPKDVRDVANRADFVAVVREAKKGSTGFLNVYIADRTYPTIVKDIEAGYIESTDYASCLANYSQLSTALSNISNEIAASKQIANVRINTRNEIDNSVKTSTITEARPLNVSGNEWTNVGMLYTQSSMGMPLISQLNSLIGDNSGVKLIFTVDQTTLPKTGTATAVSQYGYGFAGMGYSSIGAARLRVNGAFAMTINDMATYDASKGTYTFDWDALAGNNIGNGLWTLEMTAYSPIGLSSLTVSVPDQETYLAAIGADTDGESTNGDKKEDVDKKDDSDVGSLSVGEGLVDENDDMDTDINEEIQSDENDTPNPDDDVNDFETDGNSDVDNSNGDGSADNDNVANDNDNAAQTVVQSPSTGNAATDRAADVAVSVLALAASALGITLKRKC